MGFEKGTTKAVCIMGMHRSGTSIAARVLQLLGVSLGDPDLLMEPGGDNPAGYWENRAIKELNDELLAHLGGSWDQPPVLEDGWEQDTGLDGFRARANGVLSESFPTAAEPDGIVGWKDPRLCLVLPFWRTVTPIAATIILVRDPAEVADSLLVRNGIEAPQAALLWMRYLFAAAAADPGHLLLRLDDFFTDLPRTLAAITDHVGLAAPDDDLEASARSHLDPALRHHVSSTIDTDNPLVAMSRAVWNDGSVRRDEVPVLVAEAIRRGWLRPPIDAEALARARAQVVALRETVRRRRLKKARSEGAR